MQFIDYWYCNLIFVSEYYILNPLLNLLNFLLNYSDVGIPSMHNRNFLFHVIFHLRIKITSQ